MSILDRTIGEGAKQNAFKPVPTGKYLLNVIDYKVRDAGDKKLAEISCEVVEPMDGQDLTDINLGKVRLKGTLWLTDAAFGVTSRNVLAINPEIPETMPLKDAFETLPGRTFVGVVKHRTRPNSDRVEAEVDRYYAA